MLHFMIPAAILSTLLLTACGDTPPPGAAIATPDRNQFKRCLEFETVVPDLPSYAAFDLPDGRKVVLLDRVRERDAVTARFVVQEREGRKLCQASTRFADTWAASIESARKPVP